jgi:single-stranded-DNA-specific exonuclease
MLKMPYEILQGAKYSWYVPQIERSKIIDVASSFNLSYPVANVLISRGFSTKESINDFLFAAYDKDASNMSLMKDADKSVDRILSAIKNKEKILIAGDYDVDGITSSAMMMHCLKMLGADVNFFLPHRVKDGYGLSAKVVKKAAQNNYKVIITVDNGITAFEPADEAKKLGIDLIITDHHKPHAHVPDAFAVIDPHQEDCLYPYKDFAGVGVTFKVLSYLFEKSGKELPHKVYELLLLGTVADVVPLTGENRFWVRHGLSYVNKIESNAFKVLKQNGNLLKPAIKSLDVGFSVAPQINALGRLDDPRDGVKFLIGSDQKEVERIGSVLFELNQARKEIERSIIKEIEFSIQSGKIDLERENIIMAASDSWPPGVIGLVASRMVSAYGKPTLLFHLTSSGLAKGSCRSISEFNIFEALQDSSHLIEQFGGHAQAAGLSLKLDNLPKLKKELEERVLQLLTPEDLKQKVVLDACASLSDINHKLINDMAYLEPFGHCNNTPSFLFKGVVQVQKPTLLKDQHVKCQVFADGIIKPVIFFYRPELYELFLKQNDEPFDLAAQVSENHWNGRVNIELLGLDVTL